MLSDVGSATITRYGILNTIATDVLDASANPGTDPQVAAEFRQFVSVNQPHARYRGIPFPGTFMLDRRGRVTSRFFEDFYRERSTVASLMLRLGRGSPPVRATKLSNSHLDLTTYTSDAIVALGNRFSLVLDVVPKPGMHVYAPNASGYRPVALGVAPQPFVRTLPVVFPPSEIYHFRPLDERVPVYQKPFRLMQEVIPEITPEAQEAFRGRDSLTITGTLEYQACDDKVCYNPVSMPLSWTLAVKPFVPGEPVP